MNRMLDHLYPISGNNAIESASIAIGWGGNRDQQLLATFIGLQSELLKLGYDVAQPIKAVQVELNAALGSVAQSDATVGHVFIKRSQAGIPLREVTLRDNQFIITVRDYSRWGKFWADVRVILDKLLPLLKRPKKSVESITLQYLDKFQWRNYTEAFPLAEALNVSPYVPLVEVGESDQWHSNQGFYVKTDLSKASRRLDNINITFYVENNIQTLSLLLAHQYPNLTSHEVGSVEALKPLLDGAHLANKKYLRDILSAEMCNRIGLRAS